MIKSLFNTNTNLSEKEANSDSIPLPKELSDYNILHQLEKLKNYQLDNGNSNTQETNTELASYLHSNFDTMDEKEMAILLTRCLGINDIKKNLLAFEFKNYKRIPVKHMTLENFKNIALTIIDRYQWKAGGFKIEDKEWVIHTSESNDYEVKKYELLFENTLDKFDLDDEETDDFIDDLLKHLNSIAENINVEFRQKNDKKKIVRILLWAEDITQVPEDNQEDSDESVGL